MDRLQYWYYLPWPNPVIASKHCLLFRVFGPQQHPRIPLTESSYGKSQVVAIFHHSTPAAYSYAFWHLFAGVYFFFQLFYGHTVGGPEYGTVLPVVAACGMLEIILGLVNNKDIGTSGFQSEFILYGRIVILWQGHSDNLKNDSKTALTRFYMTTFNPPAKDQTF